MFNELTPLYSAPFLLGLASGLTICSWSCLPYIGPYVIGTQEGFAPGIKAVLMFSVGKIASYAVLGALAGYLGGVVFERLLGTSVFSTIMAFIIIWLGCSLFFKSKGICTRTGKNVASKPQSGSHPKLIFLGLTVGFIPCIPLSGVLLYAATGHSPMSGCWSGIMFGLGTTVSPLIILGGVMGWFSKKLSQKTPQYSVLFQKICGLILVSLGIKLLVLF